MDDDESAAVGGATAPGTVVAEDVREEAAHCRRVVLLEVGGRPQGAARGATRLGRKLEHLEASAVESDEVLVDEAVARVDVLIERHLEDRADAVVAVEAHAAAVAGEHHSIQASA